MPLLKTWVEIGQDPSLFWRLTFREIEVVIDGAVNRLRREQNDRAWMAWHIEALSRMKKLPKLKSMLSEAPKSASRKLEPVTEAAVRAWLGNPRRKR